MKTRWIVAAFVILSLYCAPGCGEEKPPAPGGWSDAAVDDKGVVEAADFAVKAEQKVLEKDKLSLVKIVSARHQVVAGMNYSIEMTVKHNDAEKTATAVVWRQVNKEYKLTSWTWK